MVTNLKFLSSSTLIALVFLVAALRTIFKITRIICELLFTFYVFKLKPRSAILCPAQMGKWVIITGSTDGIGLEYAKQYGKLGFHLVLISRSQEKLDRVRNELAAELPQIDIVVIQADFGQHGIEFYGRIERELVEKCGTPNGQVDIGILINNVGVTYDRLRALEEVNPKLLDKIVHVNITSAMQMTRIAIPHMLKSVSKRPLIVNVSAASGHIQMPHLTAYTASKACIISFSRALRHELKNKIEVQCLFPGYVATKMMTGNRPDKVPRPKWFVQTKEQYVKESINCIGCFNLTSGCFVHYIHIEMGQANVPGRITGSYTKEMKEKQRRKYSGVSNVPW